MRAVFINGSPRKGWNTHQMVMQAVRGAKAAGADVEEFNLYDLSFSGCRSCFACKVKGAKTNGGCAYPDDLRPVMDAVKEADVLVLASPVYLGNLSAQMNLFWERLMFANLSYSSDLPERRMRKMKRCAMIITMGCPEQLMERMGYTQHFAYLGRQLGYTVGNAPARMLYLNDAYQFDDYARYDISPDRADPVEKARHREQQFPIDLKRAYELGKQLCR